MYKKIILMYFIILINFLSCNGPAESELDKIIETTNTESNNDDSSDSDDEEEEVDVTPTPTPEPTSTSTPSPTPTPTPTPNTDFLNDLHQLRIITVGNASGVNVANVSILLGNSYTFYSALYDLNGNFIELAPATWIVNNAAFPAGNAVVGAGSTSMTFTPTTVGTTVIQANYSGANTNILSANDSTGLVTVSTPQVVTTMTVTGGAGQTSVANTNLPTALKVRLFDAFGVHIPGVSVLFSVTQGSGAIIGANPVVTDSNGEAEVIVKLGTVAGSNIHRYRATSVDDNTITADFVASAIAGPPHHLEFTTQPAVLFANSPFGVQPVVQLQDEFDNLVSSTDTVTLTVSTGSGALIGTNAVAMVAGVATYTNVGYNTAEAGVVLQASDGTRTGLSSAITVAAAPPGACQTNNASFTTAGGGCMDLTTGLVWSNKSSTTKTWHQAVWDSSLVLTSYDSFGRTNDYDSTADTSCGGTCDAAVESYCRSLSEGGFTDWRLPTRDEVVGVSSRSGNSYLSNPPGATQVMTSTTASTTSNVMIVMFSTAVATADTKSNARSVYCVRGDTRSATHVLELVSSPTTMGSGVVPISSAVFQIKDSNNNKVNAAGRTITLTSATLGTLGGTLSAVTDQDGRATFSAFTLTSGTYGNSTVTATLYETDLVTAADTTTFTTKLGAFPQTCVNEDADYQTLNGGCQDMSTGLVWSLPSPTTLTWHQAIWDGQRSGGSNVDPEDYKRTNDYDSDVTITCPVPDTTGVCDKSNDDYCRDLVEGGYEDWRMPTATEVLELDSGMGAGVYLTGLNFATVTDTNAERLWTSTTNTAIQTQATAFRLNQGDTFNTTKTTAYTALCVRNSRSDPSGMEVISGPNSTGINTVPLYPLIVGIVDAFGNTVKAEGLTVNLTTNTGALAGTTSVLTDVNGVATFSSFTLNTAGSPVILTATIPSLSLSVNYSIQVGAYPGSCKVDNSIFATDNGGCEDQSTLKVWSRPVHTLKTWHQAVWGGNPAADGNDGGRTNDYDSGAHGGTADSSVENVCHELNEGGYQDWRLPTVAEINAVIGTSGSLGKNYLELTADSYYWTSTSVTTTATARRFSDNASQNYTKSTLSAFVICIRP